MTPQDPTRTPTTPHDPPRPPTTPLPKIWGGRDPQPPRIDAYVTTPPFYKHLLVVFIQIKLGNDVVFIAFTIRHFVISVAAVSAGIFFMKRILYCIVMGGLAFMYEFMHVCMNVCISLYTYVGVHACMCVRLANDFINVKTETKKLICCEEIPTFYRQARFLLRLQILPR